MNKPKLFISALILLIVMGIISCKKIIDNNNYKGCCNAKDLSFNVGEGKIFVPSFFTPNADGINDIFVLYIDTTIATVSNVKIKKGMKVIHESGPYNVVHDQYQYSLLPIDISNSEELSGSYEYIISAVNKNGVVGMGNGIVCFYTYSSLSAKVPEIFCSSDCLFPMQFDGTNFNYALPSGELVSCQ